MTFKYKKLIFFIKMIKTNVNYIKITIHKAKICSDNNLSSFSLKIDFEKQTYETDKIANREIDFGGKVIS
jgi:hypothetical protein